MTIKPRLDISIDFLTAFGKLPSRQQKGIRSLIDTFNRDPKAPGLNYERIRNARNPRMRSLRINKGYRAIAFDTGQDGRHLLLWAANHDDAYAWAMRTECAVNPETGALQVYVPQTAPKREFRASGSPTAAPGSPAGSTDHAAAATPVACPSASASATASFAPLKDRELVRLGVPPAMLGEVRTVQSDADLDEMQPRLPVEAYESLFFYLAGEPYEKLILERELPSEPVDTSDFTKALARADSRVRFFVADDEAALEEVLGAPLEHWRVFLHPSQRRLVERHWNGPVRVLGGAGTGKTVVAMHRARWLARNLALRDQAEDERRRILFLTFTRNLAADIENNLRSICSPEEMERIKVANLDSWVTGFLRRQGYEFEIAYERDSRAWKKAMDLRDADLTLVDAFYEEEWEQVVQAVGIETEEDYLTAFRAGRGTRLSRGARAKVWPVFAEYRMQLAERDVKDVNDAYRDAAALLKDGSSDADYAGVIVDEAQDLSAPAYRLIRSIVPEGKDDLFVVGDGHQRIYGRSNVVLGRCGINIRGRSKKLRLNYRTTEETRNWAVRLLEGRQIDDLDGGQDDNRGFKSLTHGPAPRLFHFDSFEEQAEWIGAYLKDVLRRGDPLRGACIVARVKRERDALVEALEDQQINVAVLERADPDREGVDSVRLATMHRVKGLEFDRVAIASVNRNLVPLPAAIRNVGDEAAREFAETGERALLYVAATRAKKELLILSYGRRSRFLPGEE